jgi:hypothetical protein
MKRIIIVCEGQTEQVFCERTLSPDLAEKGYHVQAPTIKHTRGGIVKWPVLKKQIETHLLSEKDAFVTTFIDYYGLYEKHSFPGWEEAQRIQDKAERMTFLETALKNDVIDEVRHRFIPYLQLHEFEGLLFNQKDIFYQQIPAADLVGKPELDAVFNDYPNPEMINDVKETSPSHRLSRIILGYNKVVYGDILAEAIGLQRMRNKSPRFDQWLKVLESL